MTDQLSLDPDGWLRITPVAELRVTCHDVPLSPTEDEVTDHLVLDDQDLAVRPIELHFDIVTDCMADREGTATLADVLTAVYSHRKPANEQQWIVISPYGTRVQLRIDDSPLEMVRNIPEDGVKLADTSVPDPTEVLLEAKNFVPEPIPDGHSQDTRHDAQ